MNATIQKALSLLPSAFRAVGSNLLLLVEPVPQKSEIIYIPTSDVDENLAPGIGWVLSVPKYYYTITAAGEDRVKEKTATRKVHYHEYRKREATLKTVPDVSVGDKVLFRRFYRSLNLAQGLPVSNKRVKDECGGHEIFFLDIDSVIGVIDEQTSP